MENQNSVHKGYIKTYLSYGFGGFGHDVLYAVMSTYFIMFVTSQLFTGANAKWVVVITTIITVLRLAETLIDPIIGSVVDNTRTKIGRFKPWILIGGLLWAVLLCFLFTSIFGVADSNPMMYVCIFAVVYLVMDISYSFKDSAYWGMLSSLSTNSRVRNNIGTAARVGSTLAQGLTMVAVVPVVKFFSVGNFAADDSMQNRQGWFLFAVLTCTIAFISAIVVALFVNESKDAVRSDEKYSTMDVFKTLAKNDQLMWIGASYILLCLGQLVTQSLLLYYFTYIKGDAGMFAICGFIQVAAGFVSVIIFPTLSKIFGRKTLYIACICLMLVGYIIWIFADSSALLSYVGYLFFIAPYPMLFLCVMLTIADTVEYGQWKNGTRAESATLVVRVMCDKIGGAISNAVVGFVAAACGMVGVASQGEWSNALNGDTSSAALTFKLVWLLVPGILLAVSAIMYKFKVHMDESMHAKIVAELEEDVKTGHKPEAGERSIRDLLVDRID
ncbi:MAG: glycoside-pentoside-hexuronide (GPH):cation symporter [Candidatus Ancillula sp.]|jgi:lactose/raffinose/galactose permease|nr:glycoside-pentoside-hexuronide (GPH):cation symporter [Candidatus Ancillula sp.]